MSGLLVSGGLVSGLLVSGGLVSGLLVSGGLVSGLLVSGLLVSGGWISQQWETTRISPLTILSAEGRSNPISRGSNPISRGWKELPVPGSASGSPQTGSNDSDAR